MEGFEIVLAAVLVSVAGLNALASRTGTPYPIVLVLGGLALGLVPGLPDVELEPAGPFWEAEPEHQDYLQRYPHGYTCHFVRPNWKLPRRQAAS